MRSLETRNQRIFSNLIKQNQKLASDFVLKQLTIMSSAQSPASKVQRPASRIKSPASSAQRLASRVQSPASRVQPPESSVQNATLAFRVQEFWCALLLLQSYCLTYSGQNFLFFHHLFHYVIYKIFTNHHAYFYRAYFKKCHDWLEINHFYSY